AVLGLEAGQLEKICAEASAKSGATVQVANLNASDQVVISGARVAIEAASELAKAAGAGRVLAITVGGPFHSTYMQDAATEFAARCRGVTFNDARTPVVLNTTAQIESRAGALQDELSTQITQPVRWSESVQTLSALGCTTFVELGPGRVLGGLIRRTLPDTTTLA